MNEQQLILNVFAKYFNKTDIELTELLYDKGENDVLALKDDASTILIEMDADKVKRIRTEAAGDSTKKFDDGYKKANKEIISKFDKSVKEKYSIDSDASGIELIDALVGSLNGDGKITLEKIKAHPEFLRIEKEWQDTNKEKLDALQGDYDEFKNGVARNKTLSGIKGVGRELFLKLNPNLSEDSAKAERQTQNFLNVFDKYEYETVDNTTFIMDGGKRLEDSHGNPTTFDAFVKTEAEKLYDFAVQKPKVAPGNKPGGDSDPTKSILSKKDYNKMVNEAGGDSEKLVDIGSKYTYAEE